MAMLSKLQMPEAPVKEEPAMKEVVAPEEAPVASAEATTEAKAEMKAEEKKK